METNYSNATRNQSVYPPMCFSKGCVNEPCRVGLIAFSMISLAGGLAAAGQLSSPMSYYALIIGAGGSVLGAGFLIFVICSSKKNTFDYSFIEISRSGDRITSIKLSFSKMTSLLNGRKRASQFEDDPTTKRFVEQSDLKAIADAFSSQIPKMKIGLKITQLSTEDVTSEPNGRHEYEDGDDPQEIYESISSDHKTALYIASGYNLQTNPVTKKSERAGDPIADNMICSRFTSGTEDIVIFSGADGSGHGETPYLSAVNANSGFISYLKEALQKGINDQQSFVRTIVLAIDAANKNIVEQAQKDKKINIGMTTHLGMVVYKMSGKYYGVASSVGDMKLVIMRKNGEITDLTKGNRNNVDDVTDPGGQLGPKLGPPVSQTNPIGTCPDLRNLTLVFFEAEEGDILLPMSDGVHDNFDPKIVEKQEVNRVFSPEEARQLLLENGVQEAENLTLPSCWPYLNQAQRLSPQEKEGVQKIQELFFATALTKLRNMSLDDKESIGRYLVSYAIEKTEKQRTDIEKDSPIKRHYGKMDHFSCAEIKL